MLLEVFHAADVFVVRITVGSCGESAFAPDPRHPLVDAAFNLRTFQNLKYIDKKVSYRC